MTTSLDGRGGWKSILLLPQGLLSEPSVVQGPHAPPAIVTSRTPIRYQLQARSPAPRDVGRPVPHRPLAGPAGALRGGVLPVLEALDRQVIGPYGRVAVAELEIGEADAVPGHGTHDDVRAITGSALVRLLGDSLCGVRAAAHLHDVPESRHGVSTVERAARAVLAHARAGRVVTVGPHQDGGHRRSWARDLRMRAESDRQHGRADSDCGPRPPSHRCHVSDRSSGPSVAAMREDPPDMPPGGVLASAVPLAGFVGAGVASGAGWPGRPLTHFIQTHALMILLTRPCRRGRRSASRRPSRCRKRSPRRNRRRPHRSCSPYTKFENRTRAAARCGSR